MDTKVESMKIPKIEYEVYYPLNETHLTILDLSVCKNIKIDVLIPVQINDNDVKKYNPDSDYYNDVCSKTTSEGGTDVSLTDRKNKFIEENMTLCEEDCKLIGYNFTTKKAKCSCIVKQSLSNIRDIRFDKDKLYKNFIDINNLANIKLMKCFKKVISKEYLIKNYGFYIFSFIYILYFICLFLFICKYYYQLINDVDKVIKAKIKIFIEKNATNAQIRNSHFIKQKKFVKKFQKPINPQVSKSSKNKLILNSNKHQNIFNSSLNIIKKKGNPPIKKSSKVIKLKTNINCGNKNKFILKKNKYSQTLNKTKFNSEKENILKLNDSELNSLPYQKALIFDKRTYFQYYISLLKINHLLIFSFYSNDKDYNSQIIKMFLFFLFFSAHFTINALFFNDDTMHKIYIDEGEFDFIYQIPIIIYSSLISGAINTIIKYFALTESLVLELKNQIIIKKFDIITKNIHRKIKSRFILFFVISFLILLFFMYYITCFCGVYINTQIHLIKDSVISFALPLIYPFGLFLIPGIFRICSLNSKDKNHECLYRFSMLIEYFVA